MIISYRRLRTTYRSHPQDSRIQRKRVAQYEVYIRNSVGGENVSVRCQPIGLFQVVGRREMWWSVQLESRSLIGGILSGTPRTFSSKRTRARNLIFNTIYTLWKHNILSYLSAKATNRCRAWLSWVWSMEQQESGRSQLSQVVSSRFVVIGQKWPRRCYQNRWSWKNETPKIETLLCPQQRTNYFRQ